MVDGTSIALWAWLKWRYRGGPPECRPLNCPRGLASSSARFRLKGWTGTFRRKKGD